MRTTLLTLALLITCSSASAMLNANTTVAPDAVHTDISGNGIIQPGAAVIQPGSFLVQPGSFLIQPNAFPSPLVSAPVKVDPNAFHVESPFTVNKGAVEVTVQPKGFSLNIESGAVQIAPGAVEIKIDASLLGDKLSKPLQDAENTVKEVYDNRHQIELIAGGIIIGLIALCWFVHVRGHNKLIAHMQRERDFSRGLRPQDPV